MFDPEYYEDIIDELPHTMQELLTRIKHSDEIIKFQNEYIEQMQEEFLAKCAKGLQNNQKLYKQELNKIRNLCNDALRAASKREEMVTTVESQLQSILERLNFDISQIPMTRQKKRIRERVENKRKYKSDSDDDDEDNVEVSVVDNENDELEEKVRPSLLETLEIQRKVIDRGSGGDEESTELSIGKENENKRKLTNNGSDDTQLPTQEDGEDKMKLVNHGNDDSKEKLELANLEKVENKRELKNDGSDDVAQAKAQLLIPEKVENKKKLRSSLDADVDIETAVEKVKLQTQNEKTEDQRMIDDATEDMLQLTVLGKIENEIKSRDSVDYFEEKFLQPSMHEQVGIKRKLGNDFNDNVPDKAELMVANREKLEDLKVTTIPNQDKPKILKVEIIRAKATSLAAPEANVVSTQPSKGMEAKQPIKYPQSEIYDPKPSASERRILRSNKNSLRALVLLRNAMKHSEAPPPDPEPPKEEVKPLDAENEADEDEDIKVIDDDDEKITKKIADIVEDLPQSQPLKNIENVKCPLKDKDNIPSTSKQALLQKQSTSQPQFTYVTRSQAPPSAQTRLKQQLKQKQRPTPCMRPMNPFGNSASLSSSITDKIYCVCNNESYGPMIACDNQACPYEWFHYECVDIVVPPRGEWYCPECRLAMRRRKTKIVDRSYKM